MNEATFKAHIANKNLPSYCREVDVDCPLDRFISYAVKVLRQHGVETYESCHGGRGHSYPEPAVRFSGGQSAGFKAFGIAKDYGLPVASLRRIWQINDGEPVGPDWEMTFTRNRLVRLQIQAERGGLIS